MKNASECRERAKECRALAEALAGVHRQQSLSMAGTWERLARETDCPSSRHVPDMLKASYDKVAQEPVPEIFHRLLNQLEAAEQRQR